MVVAGFQRFGVGVWAFILAVLTSVQALDETFFRVWYTAQQDGSANSVLIAQTLKHSVDRWTFDPFPQRKSGARTAGIQFRIDVTTSTILIELTAPPSSNVPSNERMYLFFESETIANFSVTSPTTLPSNKVSVDLLPPGAFVSFQDPSLHFFIEREMEHGAIQIIFQNAQASTADDFPSIIELSYQLEGAGLVTTPKESSSPTIAPAVGTTLEPTVS